MTSTTTRRAALGAIAALAASPAVANAATTDADPFFIAMAKWREADAVWTASFDPEGTHHPGCGWDWYIGECCTAAHHALLAVLRTTPTTDAGWAALFELITSDVYSSLVPGDFRRPLFADGNDDTDGAIRDALLSAAKMMSNRALAGMTTA